MGFGRQVLVVAVNLGQTPYGFMGKHQQLRGDLGEPGELALALAGIGKERSHSGRNGRGPCCGTGESATCHVEGAGGLIELAPSFREPQLARLSEAIRENDQVANSFYVPGRIKEVLERDGHS